MCSRTLSNNDDSNANKTINTISKINTTTDVIGDSISPKISSVPSSPTSIISPTSPISIANSLSAVTGSINHINPINPINSANNYTYTFQNNNEIPTKYSNQLSSNTNYENQHQPIPREYQPVTLVNPAVVGRVHRIPSDYSVGSKSESLSYTGYLHSEYLDDFTNNNNINNLNHHNSNNIRNLHHNNNVHVLVNDGKNDNDQINSNNAINNECKTLQDHRGSLTDFIANKPSSADLRNQGNFKILIIIIVILIFILWYNIINR